MQGIFTNRTLWATHYSQLNDYTEILHLEDDLAKFVGDKLEAYVNFRSLTEQDFRESMAQLGNIREAAIHDAKNRISLLYDVTFRGKTAQLNKRVPPFVEPYITSFCSHFHDSNYEAVNGLLSQWNRYGGDEAYVIVFDTLGLEELLEKEREFYGYYFFDFFEVIYNDDNLDFMNEFESEIEKLFSLVRDSIFDQENVDPFSVFDDLVRSASRLKHRAFKEEREVRIVACPATRNLEEYLKEENPNSYKERDDELKTIHLTPKDHICLFESDIVKSLPIRRIIVGPGHQQKQSVRKIKEFVGEEILVDCSETPYRD